MPRGMNSKDCFGAQSGCSITGSCELLQDGPGRKWDDGVMWRQIASRCRPRADCNALIYKTKIANQRISRDFLPRVRGKVCVYWRHFGQLCTGRLVDHLSSLIPLRPTAYSDAPGRWATGAGAGVLLCWPGGDAPSRCIPGAPGVRAA
jgi:hypothetical protein